MTDGDHDDLIERLREDLSLAVKRIRELEERSRDQFQDLHTRISALEADTLQQRQLQYEADVAMADAAEWYDDEGES